MDPLSANQKTPSAKPSIAIVVDEKTNTPTNPAFSATVASPVAGAAGVAGVAGVVEFTEATMLDLLSRFVVNLPLLERTTRVRVLFHLERAWWFYLDFRCLELPRSERLRLSNHSESFERFCAAAFRLLRLPTDHLSKDIAGYHSYKRHIPVAGCAIFRLVTTGVQILFIRPPYSERWACPKGKQNWGESILETAVRETHEETTLVVHLAPKTPCWYTKGVNALHISIFPTLVDHIEPITIVPSTEVDEVKWFDVLLFNNHNDNSSQNIVVQLPPLLTNVTKQLWKRIVQFATDAANSNRSTPAAYTPYVANVDREAQKAEQSKEKE